MITRRSRRPGGLRYSVFWGQPARVALVAVLTALGLFLTHGVASASGYVTIEGSGSSWAYIAVSQWINDMAPQGITVDYNPDGSAEGRNDYMDGGLVDFAGSDPPFNTGLDQLGGEGKQVPKWGYSYVPDTAGGTAFMYHLDVDGHLIRNLRLTPKVLMEIFTGAITNWDDKQITAVYGTQLPNIPITPVLRSDGSGATYFFTLWMATEFPTQWNAFCQKVHSGIHLPCGQTEFYPQFGDAKMEDGSNNVADYITASYGQGSIGYDEYAYALNSGFPVVSLLNPAGYYVGPTASNVAVALTSAKINYDKNSINYLQQNLSGLYTFKDPRSYPLSSYSYLIVPREGTPQPTFFNTNAGKTLSQFINFFLCGGQKQSKDLGYSPLPLKLVEGGLLQNSEIPGHGSIANVNSYSSCPNPTFTNGQLTILKDAPYPTACQKYGAPLNCVVKNGKAVAAGGSGGSGGSGSSGKSGKNGSTGSTGSAATGGGPADPGTSAGAANVTGDVVNLAGNGTDRALLGVITALAVIMAVATPPVVGAWMRRRKKQAGA
ncbi:MAG TPA: substrate-binding domain-containing protein [Streptosporangiaceae bacterium]|nr:substrate-binding domain-containing protein [Streptosporangiaceae bacterium]